MAASERVSGYRCQFISEVSDDLLCGKCRLVAREPHITSCCGGLYCEACLTQVLDASKPCPSCNEAEFTTFLNKRDQKKILALQAHCTMKERGCEWVGKLEDLQAHLLVDTNDCQYVDIQCPDKCGESVPRHQLPSHLADSCLNRHYFCKYCNFSATYRVVVYKHWPKCLHYPIQCPNACSVGAFERGDLEDHMKVCLLQEVSCEFSHTGCKEVFLREDEDRHMEENTQKHLLLMSAMSQRMCREFEQKLQEKKREIAEVKKEKDDQIQSLKEEKDKQIEKLRQQSEEQARQLHGEVASLQHQLHVQGGLHHVPYHCTPPTCFTVSDYRNLKANGGFSNSYDMYTSQNAGCKIFFGVSPNGWGVGAGTHMSVRLCSKTGRFDDQLKWPVKATITLQLLNQHRDMDHLTKTIECKWERPLSVDRISYWYTFISHADLEHDHPSHIRYLVDDCLVFRLTKVEIK